MLGDERGLIARLCVGGFVFFMTDESDVKGVSDTRQACVEGVLRQVGPDSNIGILFTTIMLANR